MGSADTGAREPQRLASLIAELRAIAEGATSTMNQYEAADWLREIEELALAAGVGVPPDKDLVSAPAKERPDARTWMESPECGETSRAHIERLLTYLAEVKTLASDPFASEAVALRACLLAANEALGIPGPEPSPERDIARAIIREARCEKCNGVGLLRGERDEWGFGKPCPKCNGTGVQP